MKVPKSYIALSILIVLTTPLQATLYTRTSMHLVQKVKNIIGLRAMHTYSQQGTCVYEKNVAGEQKRLERLKSALSRKKYVKNIIQKDPTTIEIRVTSIPEQPRLKEFTSKNNHPEYNPVGC